MANATTQTTTETMNVTAPPSITWSTLRAAVQRHQLVPELLLASAVLACVGVAYLDTLTLLVTRWNSDPNYSHGFLVPLVSLYLAYQAFIERNDKKSLRPKDGLIVGTSVMLFGLSFRLLTVLLPSLILQSVSMFVVLAGLIVLIGGRVWWRMLWPSLLFATFMIPLPSVIYSHIAFPLQLFVSNVSAVVLEIVGIPVHRDGNLIHLPGQVMHVAEACSGLRQLTAFVAICTCALLMMKRPTWYRATLLFSSIPIAVLINILRVTGTGMLLRFGNSAWTEGSLHTLEGLVMVGLGLLVLRMEVALLDWLLVDDTATIQKSAS